MEHLFGAERFCCFVSFAVLFGTNNGNQTVKKVTHLAILGHPLRGQRIVAKVSRGLGAQGNQITVNKSKTTNKYQNEHTRTEQEN